MQGAEAAEERTIQLGDAIDVLGMDAADAGDAAGVQSSAKGIDQLKVQADAEQHREERQQPINA